MSEEPTSNLSFAFLTKHSDVFPMLVNRGSCPSSSSFRLTALHLQPRLCHLSRLSHTRACMGPSWPRVHSCLRCKPSTSMQPEVTFGIPKAGHNLSAPFTEKNSKFLALHLRSLGIQAPLNSVLISSHTHSLSLCRSSTQTCTKQTCTGGLSLTTPNLNTPSISYAPHPGLCCSFFYNLHSMYHSQKLACTCISFYYVYSVNIDFFLLLPDYKSHQSQGLSFSLTVVYPGSRTEPGMWRSLQKYLLKE